MSIEVIQVGFAQGQMVFAIQERLANGARFAGMFAEPNADGTTSISVVIASGPGLEILQETLPAGAETFDSVTPDIPAAAWYEREINDQLGIRPSGHPRLDPLILPLSATGAARPRPGIDGNCSHLEPDPHVLPPHVSGEGMFTIPYGPVRSGVFESVEYLVETFGEDIPHLHTRIYHKHRGVEQRFRHLSASDATFLAERVEGTASVAHAMALCQGFEALSGKEPPRRAQLVRLVHAELERVANHLDSVIRHTEGSGQAVAYARMSTHKEHVQRVRSALCGSRFGRGVITPGGVNGPPSCDISKAQDWLANLQRELKLDLHSLMATPSFLDRLRTTGTIPVELADAHGALGPVGRGSGVSQDVRSIRPYGAYSSLGFQPAAPAESGDALARQEVRVNEIWTSLRLAREALAELNGPLKGAWKEEVGLSTLAGTTISSVESPFGELLYLITMDEGNLVRVKPRTASFHNLSLFSKAFRGDILTDFVFIEASFGLSIAGASG